MANIHPIILLVFYTTVACTPSKQSTLATQFAAQVIDTATIFAPGIVSLQNRNVFDITFTPDGTTAFFTLRKGNEKQKIFFSQLVHQQWTSPQLAAFSTDRDECPNITPDGKTLFFGSQRPIPGRESKGNFEMNIWKTTWKNGQWSEPVPLSAVINKIQQENEAWPSSTENSFVTPNGLHYYFSTMMRGSSAIEIYQTTFLKKEFTAPIKVTGLFDNDTYWKSAPTLSPDGNYLFFNAYATPLGKGGEDIYVAKKTATGWTKAKNAGALINTSAEEANAKFSADGKYFFFARENKQHPQQDGIWSIYYLETKFLNLDQLFNN